MNGKSARRLINIDHQRFADFKVLISLGIQHDCSKLSKFLVLIKWKINLAIKWWQVVTDYKISVQNQNYSDNPECSFCGLFSDFILQTKILFVRFFLFFFLSGNHLVLFISPGTVAHQLLELNSNSVITVAQFN